MNRNYIIVNALQELSAVVQKVDGSFKSLFEVFKDLQKSWNEDFELENNTEEDLEVRSEKLNEFLSGFAIKEVN